ncbi:hypothetical protein Ndes2526B_g00998 [Nannochloris sp. 'desiccata']
MSEDYPLTAAKTASFTYLNRFVDGRAWLFLILGLFGATGQGALVPFIGPLVGKVFNSLGVQAQDGTDSQAATDSIVAGINEACLQFVYFGLGLWLANIMNSIGTRNAVYRIMKNIKQQCFASALDRSCTYFDSTSTGEVTNVLHAQTNVIIDFLSDKLPILAELMGTVVAGLAISFYYAWDVTLVAMASAPVIICIVHITTTISLKATSRSNQALQRASAFAKEVLSNIRTVFSFDAGERSAVKYSKKLEPALKTGTEAAFTNGIQIGSTTFCSFAAIPLVLWYGGLRISQGVYNGGDIFSTLAPLLMMVMQMAQNGPKIKFFSLATMAMGHVRSFLIDETGIQKTENMPEVKDVKGTIVLDQVNFAYPSAPSKQVLNSVSFTVPAGTTAALVGESGCGKSTMVGLLLRLYDPTSGRILLDGVDINTYTLQSYRKHIGLVSQEPVLFATTIGENIGFGKESSSMEDVISAAKSAQIHDFIVSLPDGYDTLVGEKGTQLSGGQKQRVAIARAFLKAPKVFVLDEATSALDTQSERAIQDALLHLTAGCTTISIAHRLSTIKDCDLIVVVSHGSVIEHGTHDELKNADGGYSALLSKYMKAVKGEEEEDTQARSERDNVFYTVSNKKLDSMRQIVSARSSAFSSRTLSLASRTSTAVDDEKYKLTTSNSRGGGLAQISTNSVPRVLSPSSFLLPGATRTHTDTHSKVNTSALGLNPDEDEVDSEVLVDKSRLIELVKPDMKLLIVGCLMAAFGGAMTPFQGLVVSFMSTVYYQPVGMMEEVQMWALILVGAAVVAGIADFFKTYYFEKIGQNLAYTVRSRMMKSLMRQEVAYFDQEENNSGAIISRLDTDAIHLKGQASDNWGMLAQIAGCLLCGYPISFVYNWRITLILTATIPLILIMSAVTLTATSKIITRSQMLGTDAENFATESVVNYKVVAAYNLQSHLRQAYNERLELVRGLEWKQSIIQGFGTGAMFFMLFGIYSLAFWYGGQLVSKGEADMLSITAGIFPVLMALLFIGGAQDAFPDVAKGQVAAERVFEILDRVPVIDNSGNEGVEPEECSGKIAFRGVKFYYPQRPDVVVFRSLTLDVPAGTSVALVGSSGSGKSTIVGLTLRFYDPVAGNVLLDDKRLTSLNIHWLRSQVGLVAQEPILFNGSIMDNIRYGRPEATLEECTAAAKTANALDFIEALPSGFNTSIGDQQIMLSGGQKQRIAIARAMIRHPQILVLDEATSALDATSERVVQEALEQAMVGRTALVIAHRLSTVRNVDRIVVLDRGNIIESGTHDELVASGGTYAVMLDLQKVG